MRRRRETPTVLRSIAHRRRRTRKPAPRRMRSSATLSTAHPRMKWRDLTAGYALKLDADVLPGESHRSEHERHGGDGQDSQDRSRLQPVQQWSAVVVEGR